MIEDAIRRLIGPLKRAAMLMVGRAVLRLVTEGGPYLVIQASGLAAAEGTETLAALDFFQQYGMTSRPFPGAEGITVFPMGNRSHGIVIACEDRRYRLQNLVDGEVALYDDQGQKVHLTRAGVVVDTPLDATVTAGGKIRHVAPDIEIHATANLKFDVGGNGEHWTPSSRTTYFSGSSSSHPSNPPEVP